MATLKLRVHSTSGPAWQPVKNGQPYNKWVATVLFACTEQYSFGRKYTATITGTTREEIIDKLDKYNVGSVINVNPNKLHKRFGGAA